MEGKIKLIADVEPLMSFIKLIEIALKSVNRPFGIGDDFSELIRIKTDSSTAGTNQLSVTLYPSDRFLCLASAITTGDFNL